MALLLFTGLFFLTIILAYIYLKRRYTLTNNDLPGTKPQIFFGNLLNSGLLMNKITFHEVIHDYQRRYGDKFVFWFGSHPCVTFCTLEHAQTILSDRHKFDQSPLFLPNFDLICPAGLSLLGGATWKRHARVMSPVFRKAKVIQHIDTIIECIDRFIDQCLKDNEINTDIVNHCQTLTTNIIGFIGFDYDLDSYVDSPSKIAFQDFVYHILVAVLFAWLPRWMIKIYLKFNWKYQRTYRQLRELTKKIVQQEQNNPHTIEKHRTKNLIASLVSSLNEQANDEQIASGLTQSEMFDEVLTAILAGYETTANAISWFIFYMSKNPQIQKRIKEELREHNLFLTDDVQYLPSLTQEKLDLLTYVECVIKEVFRLSPIAGVTTRIALCDTTVDNVSIGKGETVIIGIHNIATDARYWHHGDPTKFIPERFLGEDKNYHPYAMIPFGGGHRACIGQDLAWLELKLSIVRMMQRGITFEDTPENTGGYAERFTCFPKNMAVRVHIDRQ